MADIATDAPGAPAPDAAKPNAMAARQLAAFDPVPVEAPEPESPEEREEATVNAREASGPAKSPDAPVVERPVRDASRSPRDIAPDTAAAPTSPPASDRNAARSAQATTLEAPPRTPSTASNPPSPSRSPFAQPPAQTDQPQQGTAPVNAAAMVAGAIAGAFRRPERRAEAVLPSAPAGPRGSTPPDPRGSAAESLVNRFAVRNILDTLRGRPEETTAAAKTGPDTATAAPPSPAVAADAASKPSTRAAGAEKSAPAGGLRDKLTAFEAERLQPRRDAEQARGAAVAAAGVVASLEALERQETAGILARIRDAAKANGGIENVLSEMRPGGRFEDLRKEFNTVLSHDEGFAAAYEKATDAVAGYAEARAALPAAAQSKNDPNLARLQTLDHEIAEVARTLPGRQDGKSALDELVETGREAAQKLFATVQQAFSRDAHLRGPSPSPGLGR